MWLLPVLSPISASPSILKGTRLPPISESVPNPSNGFLLFFILEWCPFWVPSCPAPYLAVLFPDWHSATWWETSPPGCTWLQSSGSYGGSRDGFEYCGPISSGESVRKGLSPTHAAYLDWSRGYLTSCQSLGSQEDQQ